MKFIFTVCLLVSAFVLGGCTALAAPAVPSLAISPTPRNLGTIRVGFSTSIDMGDVPSLMAHELLAAQGYSIRVTEFMSAEMETAALLLDELDIANGSLRTVWLGLGKSQNANAHTIMEQVGDVWLLIARPGIKTCAELGGTRIAFTNSSSLNHALFDAYVQEHCPGLEYQSLFISSSESRATALLAGELDAAPLELADWIQVQAKAPNQFHALVDFGEALPQLKTTGVYARRAFAEQQPEAVRAYIRTLLAVHRAIRDNPAELEQAAMKYLKLDAHTAKTITAAYLARNLWDSNGGLTEQAVQYSIDFFTQTKSIPEGLTVDAVADLSHLNTVLDEVGRK